MVDFSLIQSLFPQTTKYIQTLISFSELIQTWQTEWKTASLATVQFGGYENQTLEAFVAASRLFAKFDCPVVFLNCSLLATAHDREIALLFCKTQSRTQSLLASYCACSSMRCIYLFIQLLPLNDK